MLERYRAGVCTFCRLDPVLNPTLCTLREWSVWENPFPLPHTRHHLVMAPHRHVGPSDQILSSDFTAMGELFGWAQKRFGFTGGGFAMRFGSPKQSAGTVMHLHANIIVPDLTGAVDVTLAKNPAKVTEQIARMRGFEQRRLEER
jgi:hypothetical protein